MINYTEYKTKFSELPKSVKAKWSFTDYVTFAEKWKLTTTQVKYLLTHEVKRNHNVIDIFNIG